MLRLIPPIAALVLSVVLTAAPVLAQMSGGATESTHASARATTSSSAANQVAFRATMGALWDDHVAWTRLFIISAVADTPDLSAATQRLLRNQVDIGDAIKPFYGDAAGEQLTALLTDHILIAADAVAAAKDGDAATLATAVTAWEGNADDIASFLATADPEHWPLEIVQPMLREHLTLTTAELVARLNEDWEGDAAAYDRVHEHAVMMADLLSQGLVARFPERFA
jgi:hypothetical protein